MTLANSDLQKLDNREQWQWNRELVNEQRKQKCSVQDGVSGLVMTPPNKYTDYKGPFTPWIYENIFSVLFVSKRILLFITVQTSS